MNPVRNFILDKTKLRLATTIVFIIKKNLDRFLTG